MDEPTHIFESKTDLDNIQLVSPPREEQAAADQNGVDQNVTENDSNSERLSVLNQSQEPEDDFQSPDEASAERRSDEARERMRLIVKLEKIKIYFGEYPFIAKLIPEFDVLYKQPTSKLRVMVEEALAAVSARSSENAVKGFIAAGTSALEALVPLVGLDASGLTNAVTHPDNRGMQELIKEACIKYDSLTSTPVELRIGLEIMRTIKELDRYNKERRGMGVGVGDREVVPEETLEKAKDL